MKYAEFHQALMTTLKTPILGVSVLAFILLSICMLLVQHLIVLPAFQHLQTDNIESEATRTARHLSNTFILKEGLENIAIDETAAQGLRDMMVNFGLTKIKVFDSKGRIIFSTAPNETGTTNHHAYFHDHVAKGEVFSKIVEKNTLTSEGLTSRTSVDEVYVPIMVNGNFFGAFEIYYDITEQNAIIVRNNLFFKLLGLVTWLILCGLFLILVIRTASAFHTVERVKDQLREVNDNLEQKVALQTREIVATQRSSIMALASLAEYYDPDTGEHLNNIQQYVRILLDHFPRNLKITETLKEQITLASILHDAGKTAVSVDILTKTDKLTAEEFEQVKFHTIAGGDAFDLARRTHRELYKDSGYLDLAYDIARHHHERWDGTGYPDGLKGECIPLSARIVAVADVYDALISKRPYKSPWPHNKAVKTIIRESGNHFDPEIVQIFISSADEFKKIALAFRKLPVEPDPG